MKALGSFAEIIVDIHAKEVDKIFHYAIPQSLASGIKLGSRVLVPFGPRKLEGYVVGFTAETSQTKIKEIIQALDQEPMINQDLLELARWIARNYLCSQVEALQGVMPSGIKMSLKRQIKPKLVPRVYPVLSRSEAKTVQGSLTPKQTTLMELIYRNPGLSQAELARRAGVGPGMVQTLIKKGLLIQQMEEVLRDPLVGRDFAPTEPMKPTEEQAAALERILPVITARQQETFLIHGVTGSGKTEIYLQAIAHTLSKERQAIVLVPEISLTPQIVDRFKGRFGSRIAVLHSALSAGEKYDEWRKIKSGLVDIVVGARSAIFAPLENLGLIIIDEEHEATYKQEDNPKYHAREAAIKRAELHNAVVVLGSATPAVETYQRALTGEFKLITLKARVDDRPMPLVSLVDLKEELKAGNKSIFSRELADKIQKRLESGEQVILFLNRRGFSTFVMCRECGTVMKCSHCEVALTYHNDDYLRCHYCRHQIPSPRICPHCASRYIRHFGVGTQRVEEELRKLFPGAGVLRMDMDTTGQKGSHQRILEAFTQGKASVLVGTQMIAKGHDFPRVTLVGVITADTALNMPDFRSGERTFQLLTQVAGRAGRGELKGEVVIQTYNPDHYSIQAARYHDYAGFFPQEMNYRRDAGYPPFSRLIKVVVGAFKEEQVARAAMLLGQDFEGVLEKQGLDEQVEILGPAPLARIKNKYRWQVVLKGTNMDSLRQLAEEVLRDRPNRPWGEFNLSIDVDPLGLI